MKSDAWVPLAVVARPHGVRGELRLKVHNTDSELLLDCETVLVRLADGEEQEVAVVGARKASDAILMKLVGVDDRDDADELRGASVCVKRSAFPALEPGEFYVHDIEGAAVLLGGEPLGEVAELRSYPSVDVLVVRTKDGVYEVPLVETYVGKVDAGAREIVLHTLADLELEKKKRP